MSAGTERGQDPLAEKTSTRQRDLQLVGIGGAYFLAHHMAFLFPDTEKVLMAIWPAAGVGLAALLLSPRCRWPAILAVLFLGGEVSDLVAGRPILASTGFMAANILESLGCGWLLLRTCGEKPTFSRVRDVLALLAAAVFVNAVTALAGAGTAHLVSAAPFWAFWETWWIGDGLGILLLTPAIVAWAGRPEPIARARWLRWFEASAFLALWCAVAWLSFNGHATRHPHVLQPYLLVALLAWPALRFGQRGTTLALVMLAAITVTSAAVQVGPLLWGGEDPTHRQHLAQLYVWVVTVAGLLLAASHAEARAATTAAREDQLRIRALGDNIPGGMVYQAAREPGGHTRFLYVSAGVERLHGITAEAVLNDPQALYALIVEEDRPRLIAEENDSVRDMSPFDVEARFHRPDGGIRWTRIASSPRRLSDGRIVWDGIQTDITERKQAEAAARGQTALLEAQLNASIEGVLVVDQSGNKILQNQRCIELWKIPAHIVANHDDKQQIDFVKDSLRDPDVFVRQIIYLYTHPNETSRDEIEFKDGTVLDRYSAPVIGKDGTHFGRIWTFRDITEQKRAEEALRESEEKFGKVFHYAPVLVAITDLTSGAYVDVNEEALRVSGYTRDEVIGHTAAELGWISEEDRDKLVREFETHGRVVGLEMVFRAKHGRRLEGLINGERILIGNRPCLLTVTIDLTERKLAEAKLAASEERFRKLFEESPIGIAILGQEREIMLTNQSYRELLRLSEDEIIRRGAVGILHPDSWAPSLEMSNQLRNGEIPVFHMEQRYVRGDGSDLWTDTHITAVRDADGRVLHTIGWIQDITERKRAEAENAKLQEQLVHAQRMESIGRLAGGVAHDFNNMLGVILGYVELALEDVDPAQPLHTVLMEVHKAANRSADLTRQLLAFARKQTIAPKVLDLNETVAGMLKMLKRIVGEHIELSWSPGAGLWPVKIDPSQIDQILANLCVNARDAIANVGTICIETKNSTNKDLCAELATSAPGEYVCLTVRDDGCGMDQETLARIFEPYFTTKGIGRGTGLGLATVYGTVNQSNGFIHVDSEPGKGAAFAIHLPRYKGSVDAAESSSTAATDKMATILIVEDEASLLSVATTVLGRLGHTVLAASTPKEAIRMAQAHAGEISLLITDVVMPEMNGRDLAKFLQALYPNLRSLFMSGYTDDLIADHGALDEGVEFIQKPFSSRDLAAKIQEVLASERTGPASV